MSQSVMSPWLLLPVQTSLSPWLLLPVTWNRDLTDICGGWFLIYDMRAYLVARVRAYLVARAAWLASLA
jgi:hypothetical protein